MEFSYCLCCHWTLDVTYVNFSTLDYGCFKFVSSLNFELWVWHMSSYFAKLVNGLCLSQVLEGCPPDVQISVHLLYNFLVYLLSKCQCWYCLNLSDGVLSNIGCFWCPNVSVPAVQTWVYLLSKFQTFSVDAVQFSVQRLSRVLFICCPNFSVPGLLLYVFYQMCQSWL